MGRAKNNGIRQDGHRRRRAVMSLEMMRLNTSSSEPLYLQLYRQIREQLDVGAFEGNDRPLPSLRVVATELGVSRFTVTQAFSKLLEEGYLESRNRSGYFVAERLPAAFLRVQNNGVLVPRERSPRVAKRAGHIDALSSERHLRFGQTGSPGAIFRPGAPAVDEFPINEWEGLRRNVLRLKGAHLLRYGPSQGELELRKAIASYLCDFRAARCHADQIVIVGGMQEAMLVCGLALLNPGETAWIEDPGYHQARNALACASARIVPVPIDSEGIVINGQGKEGNPKLIYVTPSHQFPLGVTMSAARRKALLDFAHTNDSYILEDDYNSEFRFDGPPLPCLQGSDDAGRVIYAGTMSKILYPSLRLGYLAVPEQLVETIVRVRSAVSQQSPSIDQVTLAHFISEGFFLSHVKRMRKVYAQRRECFIEEFHKALGLYFDLDVKPSGLHFVAWLHRAENLPFFLRAGDESRIDPANLSFFCIKARLAAALLFGVAAWSPVQIRQGLAKYASRFEQQRKRAATPLSASARERPHFGNAVGFAAASLLA